MTLSYSYGSYLIILYQFLPTVAILVWLSIVSNPAGSAEICNIESLRLPERVKPTHYELLLKLSELNAPTYEGQVKINVTIGELNARCPPESGKFSPRNLQDRRLLPFGCDQNEIVLNANSRVNIKEAKFIMESSGEADKRDGKICQDMEKEMASIRFERGLEDNSQGQLIIDFEAQIGSDEKANGIYRSSWLDPREQKNIVSLVSQFEPASARKALPCFDEPAFKSTFDVTIEHQKDLTALSNTKPVEEESVKGNSNLVRTYFDRTPIMSTYLLAFSVGPYDHVESKIMDERMQLRVFTPPKHQELGRIALDMGRRAYAALHDYFDIEQPLKKIDFLPMKMSFGGAMENWGLVTFKDVLLLVEGEQAKDDSGLSQLAVVISHELAHHWFGNLVTMKWWDNLWLNEAFAEWLGYMIADEIHPEYNVKISMVEKLIMRGLDADGQAKSTHPIKNPKLETIKDIQDSFDQITYSKGGAVLRMLEGYVGHETFKLAIRDYLNKFKYQNTDETDLWNAVQARSHLPVAQMMDSWLNQAGFPLVSAQYGRHDNTLSIKQERFEQKQTSQGQKQLWVIPINLMVVRGDKPGVDEPQVIKFVLSNREQHISLPKWFDPTRGHWLKLNAGVEGFFRVQYDSALFNIMRAPIKRKRMTVIDRMNVLDDMRALFIAGKVEAASVVDLLSLFDDELHPALILRLAKLLNVLRQLTKGHRDKFKVLVNYFHLVMLKDTKQLWERTIEDGVTKRTVLASLILVNYRPAIEFGRNKLAKMSEEDKAFWPQLGEYLARVN